MSTDIKRLLRKKGWTGREVGQALLINLTDSYRKVLLGDTNPEPLFSQAQLQNMINSLADRSEGAMYNRFAAVQSWVVQYQAVSNAYLQQVQAIINSLVATISTAEAAENELQTLEKLPCIMTQKQYDEYRERRIREQLDNGGEPIGNNVFLLIYDLLRYYRGQLSENPRKANPLKALKKKYQHEDVTAPYILDQYNEVMGIGYYTLPDGRRSDQMSAEEWREAVSPPEIREAIDQALKQGFTPIGANGKEAPELIPQGVTPQMMKKYGGGLTLAESRLINREKLIFEGATEAEADRAQEEREVKAGLRLPAEWHTEEEPPKHLKKWDFLEDGVMEDFFPALFGEYETSEEFTRQAEAFKEEFPELTEAMLSELDRILEPPEGAESISALPVSEWEYTVYSWRDLYEMDFPGFRAEIESDLSIFGGNWRALVNGIAILRPSDVASPDSYRKSLCIDENGYYKPPEAGKRLSTILGLERYTPANEDEYIAEMEKVESDRKTLESSLYWLRGYNLIISLIAEYTEIEDFKIFSTGLDACLDRIEALNGLIAMLYGHIKDTHYEDEKAKEAKLQVLRDLFYHFKAREIEPTEEAIAEAKKAVLDNLKGFSANNEQIMAIFSSYPATEGEEG